MAERHPDCHCKRAVHVHGSRTTYVVHRCRCAACREDNRVKQREQHLAKVYGRYDKLVDAEPVRQHVRSLMAQGMGWRRVAEVAGVAESSLYCLLHGKYPDEPEHPAHRPPRKQVLRANAEKLLAVQLDLAGGQRVDATGTRRRVQALAARGWSLARIGARLGIRRCNMHLHEDRWPQVTVATARAVRDLYEELWDVEPPTSTHGERIARSRALNAARRAGWAPPLAWDEGAIDDPTATPATETHRGDRGVHPDDILHMAAWATDLDDLARQLGITRNSLDVAIRRHGIELPRRITVAQQEANVGRRTQGRRAA